MTPWISGHGSSRHPHMRLRLPIEAMVTAVREVTGVVEAIAATGVAEAIAARETVRGVRRLRAVVLRVAANQLRVAGNQLLGIAAMQVVSPVPVLVRGRIVSEYSSTRISTCLAWGRIEKALTHLPRRRVTTTSYVRAMGHL